MTEKRLRLARAELPGFRGWLACIDVLAVSAPQVWRHAGADVVICGRGSRWLQFLPEDDFYCVTAMLDPAGEALVWYVDMIAGQGVDPDGVPWFDDLYLDLIAWPDGEVTADDRDELDAALRRGEISAAQHMLALETAERLTRGLLRRPDGLRALTESGLAALGPGDRRTKAEDTNG